ncbi:MAG: alpha/beta hydrolase-fold protein [Candidatus Aminicenantes bacterium]|nr:alpha/beta hydrolase-fold protein [Candidatus Aminicenantes bacterium]
MTPRKDSPYYLKCLSLIVMLALSLSAGGNSEPGFLWQDQTGLRFEITFPAAAHSDPITGRVYVILTTRDRPEPRLQTGFDFATGIPIWGKNVQSLKPGEAAGIDDGVFGFPLKSIQEIPPGEYYVQGFVNIYTEFKRSDGHTLWLHNDQWEGQLWNVSPGNLYSDVSKVTIDPAEKQTIALSCKNVIPPVVVPPDSEWVKRIKFQSKILTEFWGQPIYLGATILLPKGYDDHPDVTYPVNYDQGHFSLRSPHGFRPEEPAAGGAPAKGGSEFYKYWVSDDCPRMLAVTFQHPCPYYDDSYAVNSPNVGPYGDAIMQELIPYIEEHFRIIREPYARVLSGGSTGGWESLALQIFQPDFFGGTWSSCPDPVDFRYYELINIYNDKNAYYRERSKIKTERPEGRDIDGQPWYTVRDTYYYEWTLGDKHRSGRQWAIWEAVYTPIGEDGYPKPLWNWLTGEIDHEVAEQWKKYDLRHYLETNWSWLGPKLVGKLHVYVGDMDTFFLNNAVVLLENFLKKTENPYYEGVVEYSDRKGHCWGPFGAQLFNLFKEHIIKYAPVGADTSRWNY